MLRNFTFILLLVTIKASGQDSTKRFLLHIGPSVSVMMKHYHFNPIENDLPAHYAYTNPGGFGLKAGILDTKTGIGADILLNRFGSIMLQEVHTDQPKLPFMLDAITATYSETSLGIAPYYSWRRHKSFTINTGILLTSIHNTFEDEVSSFQDGHTTHSHKYEDQFNANSKFSYGPYVSAGYKKRNIACHLFTTYQFMNARYFSLAENKASSCLIVGLSVGYNCLL